jgi:hypothetical protein
MRIYSKCCEESISAINLTLRKLLSKASYRFASPSLYDVLQRIIEQTSKFVEHLNPKSTVTEADSQEKDSKEVHSARRMNTTPSESLYDQYISSQRDELIKTAQTPERRLRIDETVSLNVNQNSLNNL